MKLLLAIVALHVVGIAVLSDGIRPLSDAFCGAPGLRLPMSPEPDLVSVLEAADDLTGGWEPQLRLSPGDGHHDWMDPEGRARHRRFYRLARMPRPPLAPLPNFRLTDHLGLSHELFREGDARTVVLVFTDAAGLASTWSRLRPVVAGLPARDARFWIVDPVDDRAAMSAAAAAAGVTVPVLHDAAQIVTKSFGGRVSGEAQVLDAENLTAVYHGAIDAACDGAGGTVTRRYLADALDAFLAGAAPRVEYARPVGGGLALVDAGTADYRTEIAPLLQAKCVTCHKPGDIGSWAMTNHATVAAKSAVIRANVLEGLMPPWHADPAVREFANDFSMTPGQQARLVAWLDAGAPRGGGEDPLVSVPPPPAPWPLGTPDVVLRIPRQQIPASGQVPYAYLPVTNALRTNVWLRAAVVRPGNRGVVHHALIFYVRGGSLAQMAAELQAVRGGLAGFYAGFVPGMDQVAYPTGTGKLLPAGGLFVFQMHYTPNGAAASDATEMGLYFAPAPPASEILTGAAYSTDIDIPPGSRDYRRTAERVFATAVDIHEMSPHMHYRGDSMRFDAVLPGGEVVPLLNVPKYDFAWQALYRLTRPVRLPAGSRLRVSGGFDNSRWNPFNPDPARRVTFGEQTGDEMFIGYVNYTEVR